MAFFNNTNELNIWAGPFCNIANPMAVNTMVSMGFSGVIVSPELGKKDYLSLPGNSPLPLGIVVAGNWPLCVSRISPDLKTGKLFTSPRGEQFWIMRHDADTWVYPNWEMNITSEKELLFNAGYELFVYLKEAVPGKIRLKKRPGLWNWKLDLL